MIILSITATFVIGCILGALFQKYYKNETFQLGRFARLLGLWGTGNVRDITPFQVYNKGKAIKQTTMILWPIGLVAAYKEGTDNIRIIWTWPWNLSWKPYKRP